MVERDTKAPPGGPRTQVAIHILDDGRVIFGDLPPELAEVAAILRGDEPGQPAVPSDGHDGNPDAQAH